MRAASSGRPPSPRPPEPAAGAGGPFLALPQEPLGADEALSPHYLELVAGLASPGTRSRARARGGPLPEWLKGAHGEAARLHVPVPVHVFDAPSQEAARPSVPRFRHLEVTEQKEDEESSSDGGELLAEASESQEQTPEIIAYGIALFISDGECLDAGKQEQCAEELYRTAATHKLDPFEALKYFGEQLLRAEHSDYEVRVLLGKVRQHIERLAFNDFIKDRTYIQENLYLYQKMKDAISNGQQLADSYLYKTHTGLYSALCQNIEASHGMPKHLKDIQDRALESLDMSTTNLKEVQEVVRASHRMMLSVDDDSKATEDQFGFDILCKSVCEGVHKKHQDEAERLLKSYEKVSRMVRRTTCHKKALEATAYKRKAYREHRNSLPGQVLRDILELREKMRSSQSRAHEARNRRVQLREALEKELEELSKTEHRLVRAAAIAATQSDSMQRQVEEALLKEFLQDATTKAKEEAKVASGRRKSAERRLSNAVKQLESTKAQLDHQRQQRRLEPPASPATGSCQTSHAETSFDASDEQAAAPGPGGAGRPRPAQEPAAVTGLPEQEGPAPDVVLGGQPQAGATPPPDDDDTDVPLEETRPGTRQHLHVELPASPSAGSCQTSPKELFFDAADEQAAAPGPGGARCPSPEEPAPARGSPEQAGPAPDVAPRSQSQARATPPPDYLDVPLEETRPGTRQQQRVEPPGSPSAGSCQISPEELSFDAADEHAAPPGPGGARRPRPAQEPAPARGPPEQAGPAPGVVPKRQIQARATAPPDLLVVPLEETRPGNRPAETRPGNRQQLHVEPPASPSAGSCQASPEEPSSDAADEQAAAPSPGGARRPRPAQEPAPARDPPVQEGPAPNPAPDVAPRRQSRARLTPTLDYLDVPLEEARPGARHCVKFGQQGRVEPPGSPSAWSCQTSPEELFFDAADEQAAAPSPVGARRPRPAQEPAPARGPPEQAGLALSVVPRRQLQARATVPAGSVVVPLEETRPWARQRRRVEPPTSPSAASGQTSPEELFFDAADEQSPGGARRPRPAQEPAPARGPAEREGPALGVAPRRQPQARATPPPDYLDVPLEELLARPRTPSWIQGIAERVARAATPLAGAGGPAAAVPAQSAAPGSEATPTPPPLGLLQSKASFLGPSPSLMPTLTEWTTSLPGSAQPTCQSRQESRHRWLPAGGLDAVDECWLSLPNALTSRAQTSLGQRQRSPDRSPSSASKPPDRAPSAASKPTGTHPPRPKTVEPGELGKDGCSKPRPGPIFGRLRKRTGPVGPGPAPLPPCPSAAAGPQRPGSRATPSLPTSVGTAGTGKATAQAAAGGKEARPPRPSSVVLSRGLVAQLQSGVSASMKPRQSAPRSARERPAAAGRT